MRPFSLEQDDLRGMESSIVGDSEPLAKHFEVSDEEAMLLATSVLPWMHQHNMWYHAYRVSVYAALEGLRASCAHA